MAIDRNRRQLSEGWVEKADNHRQAAREHLQKFQYSEAIECSQECIELSVKAVLAFLNIEFSFSHGWKEDEKKFRQIAEQIQKRKLMDKLIERHLQHSVYLPRLLFLANLWGDFYIEAKYGYEAGNLASAKDLCKEDEARLAERHAGECYNAAYQMRYLNEKQLEAMLEK
jgi:HEPN domain-containing protein